MNLGTGVFLSAVLISLTILFLRTREVWNWKRISAWLIGTVLTIPLVIGTCIYSWAQWTNRARPQMIFWDVRLGDTTADVKFKKGNPTEIWGKVWVYSIGNSSSDLLIQGPTGSSVKSPVYMIYFASDRVRKIMYVGDNKWNTPKLAGINGYESLSDVLTKFGEPSYISRSPNQTERIYAFDRYNVFFQFKQDQIQSEGIYDVETGKPRYAKEGADTKGE